MSRAARRGLLILAVGLLALSAVLAVALVRQSATRAGAAIGGPFTLVDQTGTTRTDRDFRGKLMLVYFGYTFCPDVCPTELQTMGEAIDLLEARGEAVTPVFVTVDPERDTPAVLAEYAPNFHPRLVALTGSVEAVRAAARAYKVFYQRSRATPEGPDYLMDHSSFIFLMDRDGRYLTHFGPGTTAEAMAARIAEYVS